MDTVKIAPKTLTLLGTALLLVAAKHPPVAPVAPPVAAAPVPPSIKQGVELWRNGDYPGAVAMWQPFANAGDADAMFNMGQAYKLGRGVPADAAVARDWYRKAAAKGHLPAQANLGIALFQVGEKPESIKWLKTAADRGEARAQYVLGIAAFNGDGLPRSQALGYGYLLRAQASGLPQATTALGSISPGLSPADRTSGEAIAASLASGAGVPAAFAAATVPRLIASGSSPRTAVATPGLPIRTPPTPTEVAAIRPAPIPAPVPAPLPAPVAAPPRNTVVATAPVATAPVRVSPPEVVVARPLPAPSPAQADAAAKSAAAPPSSLAFGPVASAVRSLPSTPPAVATTDIPASKPVPLPSTDPLAPRPVKPVATRPVETAAARPATPASKPVLSPVKPVETAALKPFETVDKPVVKKPDGWRVQLGAFSARKLADTAWAEIKAAAAPAKPIFATDGTVTKLQMGPFATRDAAKAACAKLTEAGRACFVTQG